jgi:hypothetical protein
MYWPRVMPDINTRPETGFPAPTWTSDRGSKKNDPFKCVAVAISTIGMEPFTRFASKHDDDGTGSGTFYQFFEESAGMVSLWDDASTIVEVKIAMHPDQKHGHLGMPKADYWGWIDRKGDAKMIQPSYGQFCMQFPYGFESDEELGKGKAARLVVEETRVIKKGNEIEP